MKWKCHVDEYARGRYDMILGHDLLKELVLNVNSLITSLKHIMELLKVLQQPWLIWVSMNLKLKYRENYT